MLYVHFTTLVHMQYIRDETLRRVCERLVGLNEGNLEGWGWSASMRREEELCERSDV